MPQSSTDNTGAILLLIAVALLVIAAAVYACVRERRQTRLMARLRRDAQLQARALDRLLRATDASEARMERLRRTLDERMELMNQSNDLRLEQVRSEVSEKLDARLSESFRVMSGQLAGVHRGLGEMRALAEGLTDLKKLLSGVKTRGLWGEAQLRQLLTELFAPRQFVENVTIPEGSQTRVEFALRLPGSDGGETLLPVDSKFPREDYLRLVEAEEAGDQEQAQQCAAQLERAVLEQARRIHDKYIRPPQTTDFAVMFLPAESLYAEAARRGDLIARVQERYRVLIAGPATLCALLTSLQMGLRSVSLEQRSGEVLSALMGMRQDLERFNESLQRMRQRLEQAGAELDTLEKRARRVVRAIDNLDQ